MKNMKTGLIIAIMSLITMGCGVNQNPNNNLGLSNNLNGGMFNGAGAMMNGQISFTAQGAHIDNIRMLAGALPANSMFPGTYGQVAVNGAGGVMNTGFGAGIISKTGNNGTIQMSMGTVVSGVIQLSTQIMQVIQSQMMFTQFPGQIPGQQIGFQQGVMPTIQGMGIHSVHQLFPSGGVMNGGVQTMTGTINQAHLFFYLVNSPYPIGPITL